MPSRSSVCAESARERRDSRIKTRALAATHAASTHPRNLRIVLRSRLAQQGRGTRLSSCKRGVCAFNSCSAALLHRRRLRRAARTHASLSACACAADRSASSASRERSSAHWAIAARSAKDASARARLSSAACCLAAVAAAEAAASACALSAAICAAP